MNRRTFILLSGATSAALVRPPSRSLQASPARRVGVGRLRFDLDDQRRWSVWYHSDGPPVPLIRGVTLGAWIGTQFVTLGDLEYTTVGNRRPPGGDSIIVRGRAAGVLLEAELFSGSEAAAPQAHVRLTVFPDNALPTMKGVRFFDTTPGTILPGDDSLLALVDSGDSGGGCRVLSLAATPGPEATSHGALGLTRKGRGLALAFDADDPSSGTVKITHVGLEAVSEWLPSRPLRPEGEASRLRICYRPDADGLEALRSLFAPTSPVDRARLAEASCPAGWSGRGIQTEDAVLSNADFCATHFDLRFFRCIQIEDGYERAAGDWDTNASFPHGHRWLTDQIHAKGLQATLWLAPFAVAERSGVPAAHPEWILRDESDRPIVWATRPEWGGPVYALDAAHPGAEQWLFDVARRAVQDWGYDALTIDCLRWADSGGSHHGGLTHAEAYRMGLQALRDGAGAETLLAGAGASLQHAVGFVTAMRIGPEMAASWSALQTSARSMAPRSFYHRGAWLNDPDRVVVRAPLTPEEARTRVSLVALSGGVTLLGDDLPGLDADRLALLARVFPVAATGGRPIGGTDDEPAVAPALVGTDTTIALDGPWKFRTGDDTTFAARDYDETAWEAAGIPATWDSSGHPGYVGSGWYRTRVALPSRPIQSPHLELGKIADADETFVNGAKVGEAGDRSTFRRYAVSPDLLNWGGENVIAVRVRSTGPGGGLWSVRRERPPRAWTNEGSAGWWTIALTNWEDEVRDVTVTLRELGIAGKRFNAYDCWRDLPLPDVTEAITATVAPHDTTVVAVRSSVARPQIIGTTRHLVQGAVDVVDEVWNADARSLSARSVNLDSRAYAVTVALPKNWRALECKSDMPCTVRTLEKGNVVIDWAQPAGKDIAWTLKLRSPATPTKKNG